MIGQTVSHYRIVRQLGQGGMGVVYAADDPRLGRQVAIKFVPEELAHDAHALERLRSEARTASGLNHTNICTIYDVGEYEGRPFIVMELLHGQTLRERMTSKPMKVHETLDIGIQSADALQWAHSRDVIHRDIKPANMFLVDHGQLKILDFGLAKLVQSKPSSEMTVAPTIDLTAVGVALGTVAYMSPEQVTGESLDRRTDLFSLGVVLYECATGQQPFKGKTSAVVLASILTQTPVPPVVLNSEIPIRLQEIIHNCLEKDRELRYQDAGALRTDLRRLKRDLESGASGTVKTSILSTSAVAVPDSSEAIEKLVPVAPDSQAARTQPAPSSGATPNVPGVPTTPSRAPMVWAGAAVAAIAAVGIGFLLLRNPMPSAPAETEVARSSGTATAARAAADQATASLRAGNYRAALTYAEDAIRLDAGQIDAVRVRDEARAALARFDEAIVNASKALADDNAEAATRALNDARAIDPTSPALADLAARMVAHFGAQVDAARRAQAEAARSAAATPPAAAPPRRANPVPEPAPQRPAQTPPVQAAPPPPIATPPPQSPQSPQSPVAQPVVPPAQPARPAPEPAPVSPAPPRAETPPERRPAPAAPAAPVEEDDAAIRRVIATYARAIETKDLVLFRSVKPNLTPLEQRRIEEGFRAGVNQRVNVTILSIDLRGTEAIVKAHRHDTIIARGRGQTADSDQTLTMAKAAQGWIIQEIGR